MARPVAALALVVLLSGCSGPDAVPDESGAALTTTDFAIGSDVAFPVNIALRATIATFFLAPSAIDVSGRLPGMSDNRSGPPFDASQYSVQWRMERYGSGAISESTGLNFSYALAHGGDYRLYADVVDVGSLEVVARTWALVPAFWVNEYVVSPEPGASEVIDVARFPVEPNATLGQVLSRVDFLGGAGPDAGAIRVFDPGGNEVEVNRLSDMEAVFEPLAAGQWTLRFDPGAVSLLDQARIVLLVDYQPQAFEPAV